MLPPKSCLRWLGTPAQILGYQLLYWVLFWSYGHFWSSFFLLIWSYVIFFGHPVFSFFGSLDSAKLTLTFKSQSTWRKTLTPCYWNNNNNPMGQNNNNNTCFLFDRFEEAKDELQVCLKMTASGIRHFFSWPTNKTCLMQPVWPKLRRGSDSENWEQAEIGTFRELLLWLGRAWLMDSHGWLRRLKQESVEDLSEPLFGVNTIILTCGATSTTWYRICNFV